MWEVRTQRRLNSLKSFDNSWQLVHRINAVIRPDTSTGFKEPVPVPGIYRADPQFPAGLNVTPWAVTDKQYLLRIEIQDVECSKEWFSSRLFFVDHVKSDYAVKEGEKVALGKPRNGVLFLCISYNTHRVSLVGDGLQCFIDPFIGDDMPEFFVVVNPARFIKHPVSRHLPFGHVLPDIFWGFKPMIGIQEIGEQFLPVMAPQVSHNLFTCRNLCTNEVKQRVIHIEKDCADRFSIISFLHVYRIILSSDGHQVTCQGNG